MIIARVADQLKKITIKELQDQLSYLVETFHVPEDAGILVTKGTTCFDLAKVSAMLYDGHVVINLDLIDDVNPKEMLKCRMK